MSSSSPKEELNMAAQRHTLKLQYSSEPLEGPEGGFRCTLTVSGLPGSEQTPAAAEMTFFGTAKRKKAAEASAAVEALSHLGASGLQLGGGKTQQGHLHSFAWEALAEACNTKAERELHFLWEAAERDPRGPRSVPVSAALTAKAIVRWCEGRMTSPGASRAYDGGASAAPPPPPPAIAARGRLWLVTRDLRRSPPPPEAPVDVSSDGLEFRRRLTDAPRERHRDPSSQKGSSGQDGEGLSSGRGVRAVVVPADAASGMREVQLDTSLPHLEQLAAALIGCGASPSLLMHHGKVGAPVRPRMLLLQPPNEASFSTPLAEAYGRVPHLPSLYTALPASWAQPREPPQQQQQQQGEEQEQERPSDALPLNLRASWLAGSPVEGDALLSVARINKGDGTTVWGDFGIPEALRLWAEMLPEARMAAALGAPELCRLPTSFSPAAWGPSPKPRELLRACCSGLCFEPPVFEQQQQQAAAEGGGAGGEDQGPEGEAGTVETCTAITASSRLSLFSPGGCEEQQQEGPVVTLEGTATAPASSPEGAHAARELLEEEAALLLLGDLQELAASRLMPPEVAQGLKEKEEEEGGSLCSSCALYCDPQGPELSNVEVDTAALTGIRRIASDSVVHLMIRTRGFGEGRGAAAAEEADEPRRLVVALGTGMLDPEVERLVLRLEGVGGSCRAELEAASSGGPGGPDHGGDLRAGHRLIAAASAALLHCPLGSNEEQKCKSSVCPRPHRKLRLELSVKYVRGTGAQDSHGGLFCPSLAQQRYQFVEDILSRFRPKALVDVGCGEAALLEHLLGKGLEAATEGGSGTKRPLDQDGCHLPRAILGVDVSEDALHRASDTLSSVPLPGLVVSRLSQPDRSDLAQFLKAAASSAFPGPKVGLLRQDFTAPGLEEDHECQLNQGWSSLIAGCDMVVMVEVIEHLDPGPLECVAPVLLGAIRPLICVVTTPNIEYNAVIRRAAKRKGEDKGRLRNSDHRFEWTRAEFQVWARAAAEKFGYEVSFEGVGKAVKEAEVLYELAQEQGVEALDLGPATQAAIFRRAGG